VTENLKKIDEYLEQLSDDKRRTLEALRNRIREIVPDAAEGFSYGLPLFLFNDKPLVAYGAAKKHCSLYPMSPAMIEKLKRDLKAFETSKGTIRFSPNSLLPADLVRKIVEARIAELQG
jgi:uncharacterized protein YdhG (YjbR/CyaY superfamily)